VRDRQTHRHTQTAVTNIHFASVIRLKRNVMNRCTPTHYNYYIYMVPYPLKGSGRFTGGRTGLCPLSGDLAVQSKYMKIENMWENVDCQIKRICLGSGGSATDPRFPRICPVVPQSHCGLAHSRLSPKARYTLPVFTTREHGP